LIIISCCDVVFSDTIKGKENMTNYEMIEEDFSEDVDGLNLCVY